MRTSAHKIHWVLYWVCFAGILCSYSHKWVVPSKEIKYTKATVTQSHFEKPLLVCKQGFSISWSVCKWVTKDLYHFSFVSTNICTNQGEMLRASRWLHWELLEQLPQCPGVQSCNSLCTWRFARISGNSEGLTELLFAQHNFTWQGVQTRRLFKQEGAPKKSMQAAPSNSLSLKGERFSSLTLLQDLLCVLQPSISTAWVSTKSLAFTAARQQPVFVLPFFPRNDSQWSTSHLFFF